MDWKGRRGSRNIEDRRMSAGSAGGIGVVGMLIVLAIGYFFGIDISPLVGPSGLGSPTQVSGEPLTEQDQAAGQFVSVTLADTEEVWTEVFRAQLGQNYSPATLVLFKGVTQSPCGGASGATGPFYCPADRKVYLDTSFFTTMARKMGATGDFAAAYVVAHEVAHHVQNELGILGRANAARSRMNKSDSNAVSVEIELQADCLSGVWANKAAQKFGSIDEADVMEAINAAKAVGDDTLQRSAGQVPMPDSFTHGTSEQRMRAFASGFVNGDLNQCRSAVLERL